MGRDYFWALTCPYGDNSWDARDVFNKLKNGIESFPFDCPHQISLATGSYGPFVGVLLLPDDPGDYSVETFRDLKKWIEGCGARFGDHESLNIRGSNIETSLGAGYEVIESAGSISARRQARSTTVRSKSTMMPNRPTASRKWWQVWR